MSGLLLTLVTGPDGLPRTLEDDWFMLQRPVRRCPKCGPTRAYYVIAKSDMKPRADIIPQFRCLGCKSAIVVGQLPEVTR